jgi:hypothetical protein
MAEQRTTLFDPPAGDRPTVELYQPGTWLAEPPAGQEEDATPSPSAQGAVLPGRRRLLLDRLLDAEERLTAYIP